MFEGLVAITCTALYFELQAVKNQYSSSIYEVEIVDMFKFHPIDSGEMYIEVQFSRELNTGWLLALRAHRDQKVRI